MTGVSKEQVENGLRKTGDHQWEIVYQSAECRFSADDPDVGIISHLNMHEPDKGQGIGSAMIELAVETLREEGVEEVHAQIRSDDGATAHVLQKFEFTTKTWEKSSSDRVVVDGVLRLN